MKRERPRNPLVLPMILRHRHQEFKNKKDFEDESDLIEEQLDELNDSKSDFMNKNSNDEDKGNQ